MHYQNSHEENNTYQSQPMSGEYRPMATEYGTNMSMTEPTMNYKTSDYTAFNPPNPAETFRTSTYPQVTTYRPTLMTTSNEPVTMKTDYTAANQANPAQIEAAIAGGRVYSLPNSSYASSQVVAQAGISTIYDSSVIATFESELEIIPPQGETDYQKHMEYRSAPAVSSATRDVPVLYRPRKNHCC